MYDRVRSAHLPLLCSFAFLGGSFLCRAIECGTFFCRAIVSCSFFCGTFIRSPLFCGTFKRRFAEQREFGRERVQRGTGCWRLRYQLLRI